MLAAFGIGHFELLIVLALVMAGCVVPLVIVVVALMAIKAGTRGKVEPLRPCPGCGQPVSPAAAACPKCGREVGQAGSPDS
jgi:hypothetical protein